MPKANGYEALHTTVMSHTGEWVEIQIRSRRMDEVAEKGYAAHWKYKEAMHVNNQLDNWLDRIKEMIESPDSDALSFLDDVKGYFFLEEISVFTPQGELRTLPAGSTILDFAYAIHSELGDTCIGAKVDKKLAPINHVLKSGQQVEIITSRKQAPVEEWLSYVVTTRAKTNIKIAVRREKKKFVKPGREKLSRWFQQMGIEFSNENVKRFLTATNSNTLVDLYYSAAQDKIGIKDVKSFAASSFRNGWLNFVLNTKRKREPVDPKTVPPGIAERDHLDYTVATCCNPIPGDEVVGFTDPGSGTMHIHRTKCSKAQELMSVYGNHMVKVNWTNHEAISFLTDIKITGIDKKGLINEITRIISNEMNLNIKSFHIDAENGLTQGSITLFVQNIANLNDALKSLTMVEGITHVTRVD
jgi:GTP pyrophosphokinase